MASHPIIKLEGPQPPPYIYPKSVAAAKIINVPDYKVINYNYLFDYATATGNRRDRLPLWNAMKKSKYVDPFTGKRVEPMPPILFDMVGQPAGWGISIAEAFGRGPTLADGFIGANDNVMQGYPHIDVHIAVQWPCYLHYPPFKMQFTIGENRKSRAFMAHMAAQAIQAFLTASQGWSVDPVNKYWSPHHTSKTPGITGYEMRLVALVNTHEQHWRCDIAIVRPLKKVPSDCFPTLLDPVQYKFF